MIMAEGPVITVREDEIELDLGLSIGGSFRKLPEKSIFRDMNGCTDRNRGCVGLSRTSSSGSRLTMVSDGDNESAVMDPKEKREIHALRRREAKRKRDEKQHKRGRIFGCEIEDGEGDQEQRLKREKRGDGGMKNVDLNLSDDQVDSKDHCQDRLQYVPIVNAYAFPCVVPYWTTGNEKTVHHRRFTPFQMSRNVSFSNECRMEHNGNKDGKSMKTASSGSPVCSSSVISDNYQSSSSHDGCSSSYTKSNSSISSPNRPQTINNCSSSLDIKPKPYNDNTTRIKEEVAEPEEHELPSNKSSLNGIKKPKMENGKPPKPQIQSHSLSSSLQQMPCVSTKGIGPNGKTITGFLYRYSKSVVSILCVCHGNSFSPAEFVKHAGGGEVSHPLRHITVLPPANGMKA